MQELWKDIEGYEGLYQISNLGRVKALSRIINGKNGSCRCTSELIMKDEVNYNGYRSIHLTKEGRRMRHRVHLLVWDAFGTTKRNGKNIVVDHIDNNKLNSRIDNLQLLTARENLIKGKSKKGRLTGAYPNGNKWFSHIKIGNTTKYLGTFDTEFEAHKAYMKEKILITKTY